MRWASGVDPTGPGTGTYAFVADLPRGSAREGARKVPEGLLSWKPLDRVCDPENGTVVSNIPAFLPDLSGGAGPMEYRCEYVDGKLAGLTAKPL